MTVWNEFKICSVFTVWLLTIGKLAFSPDEFFFFFSFSESFGCVGNVPDDMDYSDIIY